MWTCDQLDHPHIIIFKMWTCNQLDNSHIVRCIMWTCTQLDNSHIVSFIMWTCNQPNISHIVIFELQWFICHFSKPQIDPFISKGTTDGDKNMFLLFHNWPIIYGRYNISFPCRGQPMERWRLSATLLSDTPFHPQSQNDVCDVTIYPWSPPDVSICQTLTGTWIFTHRISCPLPRSRDNLTFTDLGGSHPHLLFHPGLSATSAPSDGLSSQSPLFLPPFYTYWILQQYCGITFVV